MTVSKELLNQIIGIVDLASKKICLEPKDYAPLCEAAHAVKMYYDIDFGEETRYRNHRTHKLAVPGKEESGCIILFDNGKPGGDTLKFTYYYGEIEYSHAYLTLEEGISSDSIDHDLYAVLSNFVYVLVSRDNMRHMLDFAETVDAQTGIPNSVFIQKRYAEITKSIPGENFAVLCVNLQNFKYINEVGTSKGGDEAICAYAHKIATFIDDDECIARLGGDNFVAFVKKENLTAMTRKLRTVTISKLESIPGRSFEISSWIGVSSPKEVDRRPFGARLNEAATACNIGKSRLKLNLVFFSDELRILMNQGREILSMFYPAVKNHEFTPFFQAKVNMQTGKLVGFEALCRWIHEGKFIFPDQFIPILDKEGLIHDLDMTIFRETCRAIKRWKDMGLNPPRISSNFSRKNLFVPDIEEKIYNTIIECGIDVGDVEIEITESVQEAETTRLIDFVRKLKSHGLHISIDDFGTGYSSLMLIHNIDADVIKIDKSFVDEIQQDHKSRVLIESIISIANNLDMETIAEGVETADQGRELLKLGCLNAQGYYYSKPVDFESAADLIRQEQFEPIA